MANGCVCFDLTEKVQVIAWKDSSIVCRVGRKTHPLK